MKDNEPCETLVPYDWGKMETPALQMFDNSILAFYYCLDTDDDFID